ncbi:MAG: hypothetical protein FWC27_03455 [Firmicutes bacterium]|nr:hypothetical protein [Bacillota bacterium]
MKPLYALLLSLCLLALCACGQVAPEAYKPVLDDLHALYLSYSTDNGYTGISGLRYAEAIIGAWLYGPIAFYAVTDINSDGIPELLLYQETAEDMCLRSLFTLKDGEPFCVESFPARCRRFAADGTMYYVRAVEQEFELYSYKLEAGATEFTLLTVYYNYRGKCSKFLSGWEDEVTITEEEFNAALEIHNNPPNPMKLTFIPIEQ